MELAPALTEALERLLTAGRVEVRENEAWLAALEGFRYEVRPQGGALLLHLWSAEGNLGICRGGTRASRRTPRAGTVPSTFWGVARTAIFRRKSRFAQERCGS